MSRGSGWEMSHCKESDQLGTRTLSAVGLLRRGFLRRGGGWPTPRGSLPVLRRAGTISEADRRQSSLRPSASHGVQAEGPPGGWPLIPCPLPVSPTSGQVGDRPVEPLLSDLRERHPAPGGDLRVPAAERDTRRHSAALLPRPPAGAGAELRRPGLPVRLGGVRVVTGGCRGCRRG